MNPDRAIAVILTVSLVAVLILGVWLLRRAHRESEPPPAPPTATPAPPPTAAPTLAAAPTMAAAPGYRLAGTVIGDLSYAIIEDPHGGNQLYRPGQTVPGLGEVISIEADRITLAGSDGTIALQLAPGATPTTGALPTLTAAESAPYTRPARRPRRDRSESESSP